VNAREAGRGEEEGTSAFEMVLPPPLPRTKDAAFPVKSLPRGSVPQKIKNFLFYLENHIYKPPKKRYNIS